MKRKDRIRSRVLALVMTAAIVFTDMVFSRAGTIEAEAAGPINGNVALHSLAVGSIIGPNTTVTGVTTDGDIVFQYSAILSLIRISSCNCSSSTNKRCSIIY